MPQFYIDYKLHDLYHFCVRVTKIAYLQTLPTFCQTSPNCSNLFIFSSIPLQQPMSVVSQSVTLSSKLLGYYSIRLPLFGSWTRSERNSQLSDPMIIFFVLLLGPAESFLCTHRNSVH